MNFFHNIKNIFILKKEIKNRIIRDIRELFKHKEEQEHYYRPVRVGNVWGNNYIGYESNNI